MGMTVKHCGDCGGISGIRATYHVFATLKTFNSTLADHAFFLCDKHTANLQAGAYGYTVTKAIPISAVEDLEAEVWD